MFKRITTFVSVSMLSLTSGTAIAEPAGYLGVGYGQYKFKFEDSEQDQELSEENNVGKIFLGVQANDAIGAELTYLSFNDGEDGAIKSEIEGVSAALTLGLPVGQYFALKARGGWFAWEANYSVSNLPIEKKVEGDDLFYGVGVELGLGKSIDIRLDYDRYQIDEEIDPELDIASLSAEFNF